MTVINKHIFKEFMLLTAGVLIGILVVYLCIEFLQKADRLIRFQATLPQVIRYFLYGVPGMISQALPMSALIASLWCLGGMSRHNEIIAMRASGISMARIMLPVIAGGACLSTLAFVNNELVMPQYSAAASRLRTVEIEKKQQQIMFQQQKLWLRGPDNTIVNIELVSPNRDEMIGVNVYKLNPDFTVREQTRADRLVWNDGSWRVAHGTTYLFEGDLVTSHKADNEIFHIVDNPKDLGMIVKDSAEMTFPALWDYVAKLKSSGYQALGYEVDLYGKLAFPFASLLMVLISVPFSVQRVRSGGTARGFAFAMLIAFIYYTLMSIGMSLGRSGVMPPIIAAWIANLLFGAAGLVVLFRMERIA
jgi:lipopolysaccharide export system permease protein